MVSRYRGILAAISLLAPLALSGCGARNPVAGQVTFEGRPVEWGFVKFTPDLDKGNDAPSVTLRLRDGGRFSSAEEGQSLVSGEYNVLVSAVVGTGPQPPTVERRFPVTIPEGGKADLAFDVTRKSRKGKPADQELDE